MYNLSIWIIFSKNQLSVFEKLLISFLFKKVIEKFLNCSPLVFFKSFYFLLNNLCNQTAIIETFVGFRFIFPLWKLSFRAFILLHLSVLDATSIALTLPSLYNTPTSGLGLHLKFPAPNNLLYPKSKVTLFTFGFIAYKYAYIIDTILCPVVPVFVLYLKSCSNTTNQRDQ